MSNVIRVGGGQSVLTTAERLEGFYSFGGQFSLLHSVCKAVLITAKRVKASWKFGESGLTFAKRI